MSLLSFALVYSGLVGLCLAMDRHQRTVLGRPLQPSTAVGLRVFACGLLAASVLASVAAQPGATGYVAWFGFVTAAGLALIFLLPYAPRAAAALALGAPVAAGLLIVSQSALA